MVDYFADDPLALFDATTVIIDMTNAANSTTLGWYDPYTDDQERYIYTEIQFAKGCWKI